jgi:hypothetical protein
MAGAVLVGDANGLGAALGRVRVAPVPPSPSPVAAAETVERQVAVTEPVERAAWLALGAGLLLSVAGGGALLRARRTAGRGPSGGRPPSEGFQATGLAHPGRRILTRADASPTGDRRPEP